MKTIPLTAYYSIILALPYLLRYSNVVAYFIYDDHFVSFLPSNDELDLKHPLERFAGYFNLIK